MIFGEIVQKVGCHLHKAASYCPDQNCPRVGRAGRPRPFILIIVIWGWGGLERLTRYCALALVCFGCLLFLIGKKCLLRVSMLGGDFKSFDLAKRCRVCGGYLFWLLLLSNTISALVWWWFGLVCFRSLVLWWSGLVCFCNALSAPMGALVWWWFGLVCLSLILVL